MVDIKELRLLNKDEAENALNRAIRGQLDIYIIDIDNNIPFLLKIGDLEKIRKAIPDRTDIILEPAPAGIGVPRFDMVGFMDLRVKSEEKKSFANGVKESCSKEIAIIDNIDLLKNEYVLHIMKIAKQLIRKYSEWRSNNEIQKNMIGRIVEPMIENLVSDTREQTTLKRILISEFKELQ